MPIKRVFGVCCPRCNGWRIWSERFKRGETMYTYMVKGFNLEIPQTEYFLRFSCINCFHMWFYPIYEAIS